MLGDIIEKALSTVGITSQRVSRVLGHSCGCEQRKQMLNQLDLWARRVLAGKTENAVKYFNDLIGEWEE